MLDNVDTNLLVSTAAKTRLAICITDVRSAALHTRVPGGAWRRCGCGVHSVCRSPGSGSVAAPRPRRGGRAARRSLACDST
ncbi:hypothetical protein E2C01_011843 [Portunus trituberculatus]|uniref:Uncharacterized protein n=1 Tax=Portunus trituberculatus TaxID=210409 RepID=A0A5B7DCF3_PORTR|nr:hypothetical protein [Portunus trituberculatus]